MTLSIFTSTSYGGKSAYARLTYAFFKYLTTTYTTACENITINGLPPSSTFVSSLLSSSSNPTNHKIEEYEPLDSKAHSRALELSRKEEELLEEIATLKREAPVQAAENWKAALKAGIDADEEAMRNASRMDDGKDVRLGIGKRERQEEMERTWKKGVEVLGRLKKEMPGTTAKMERAKRAAEYVLAEEKNSKRRT